jgi:hypothetical protein
MTSPDFGPASAERIPAPTGATGHLHAELQQLRTLVLDPSYRHPTFADLVLERGRDYTPAPWPAGAHPQLMGDCFAAAHEWAQTQGWTYCEGYALSADVLIGAYEHAWCLTPDGRVADPAVPDGWVLAYRGLPLTASFIRAQGRGDHPAITIPRGLAPGPNTDVLRDGLPPDALASSAPFATNIPAAPPGH